MTRVVIDLKSAQPYRIYPSGKTVIVKLMTGEQRGRPQEAHLDNASYTPPSASARAHAGSRIQEWTAEHSGGKGEPGPGSRAKCSARSAPIFPFPPLAAQEQVIVNTGLLPVRDALTSLLNGSRFNFIIVGADNDPSKVKSVILSFRGAGGMSQPAIGARPRAGRQLKASRSPNRLPAAGDASSA